MDVYEIEALVRAADQLSNYSTGTSGDKVHEKILDLVAVELGRVESNNEVASLQVSNSNKQANLNLLALSTLDLASSLKGIVLPESFHGAIDDLEALAKSLIQEDPAANKC